MIERLVFKPLPALYEINMHSNSGKLMPGHERTIVFADILDDPENSREDIAYDAVVQKAQTEGIDDLTYSLRLMKPKEIRDYLRPKLRWAMIRATEESFVEATSVKQLTRSAIGGLAVLHGFTNNQKSLVG